MNSAWADSSRIRFKTADFPVDVEIATLRKLRFRLIPFLFLLYIVCYLDRVNVGFAALRMNHDLGFTAGVFGFGAGVFFLGYALFEVPSNLVMSRVGARRWISRIMISWGVLASAMALVRGPQSFYILRCLLGAAETGFYAGIIFYLSEWFPIAERSRVNATFLTAIPISGILGGPISGALLGLEGRFGVLSQSFRVNEPERISAPPPGFIEPTSRTVARA